MPDGWLVDIEGTKIVLRVSARPDDWFYLSSEEARALRNELHLACVLVLWQRARTANPDQLRPVEEGHIRTAAARALVDIEHIYSLARLVWGGDAARIWLESSNAYLSGARPLDALLTDGPGPVMDALDAEKWGGSA